MVRADDRGRRSFDRILRLYPREFRDRFGDGMRYAFAEERAAATRVGPAAVAWLWVHPVEAIRAE